MRVWNRGEKKQGPSPAPSLQKQVRNYKLEIETSNAGHGNQKSLTEDVPGVSAATTPFAERVEMQAHE